jgi:hypothetical protein
VYKAKTDNSGVLPSVNPLDWEFHKKVHYRKTKFEFTGYRGFIVHIPIALVYDDSQMAATINYYRLSSILYTINKY